MRKTGIILALLGVFTLQCMAQRAKSIRINEVMTNNTNSLQDAYGKHLSWLEIANTSFSTYNVRGMYITTNRQALDKTLSVPERIALMDIIPNGSIETNLTGRQHLIFFLNSYPARGTFHLRTKVDPSTSNWIAIFDGNAVDLIDSVSVPVLNANESYARGHAGPLEWSIKNKDDVTPKTENFTEAKETKPERWKRIDPHGIALSLLSMGIVFTCLILLYVCFSLLGLYMKKRQEKKALLQRHAHPMTNAPGMRPAPSAHQLGDNGEETDEDIYLAVISMALKEYVDNIHDVESNVITIRPHRSNWNNLLK